MKKMIDIRKKNCSVCAHWDRRSKEKNKCNWKKALVDDFFEPSENICGLFQKRVKIKEVIKDV